MRLKFWLVFLLALLSGCTRDLSQVQDGSYTDSEIQMMTEQLEGKACYWFGTGDKVGLFDPWMSMMSFDQGCKRGAAMLLAQAGTRAKPAVPALIKALEDQTPLRVSDSEQYPEGSIPIRAESARALGKIGDPRAIDGLIALFETNRNPKIILGSERRQAVIEALVEIGVRRPDVISVVMQGLDDQDDVVKVAAAKAAGQLKVEQAIFPLTKLLKDPSNFVRRQAAKSLGMFGTKSHAAIPLLIQTIENPPSDDYKESARASAALALGDVGAYEQKEFLTQLSQDKNSEVSWAAKKSLEKLDHKKTDTLTNDESYGF